MTGTLSNLDPNKLTINRVEGVNISPGGSQVLLDVDGPGYVDSLWMAVGGGNNPTLDGRIQIFYDGSATAAFDMDLGDLLATHWGASGHHLNTEHIHVEATPSAGTMSFFLNFTMPFGQHIKIVYYYPNLSSQVAGVFSMAAYRLTATDTWNGWRLRSSGYRYADQFQTRAITAQPTWANISGATGGSIVYLGYICGVNATAFTMLERDLAIYIDGESTPSLRTTGTEDTFDSGWYFSNANNTDLGRHSMVGVVAPSAQPYVLGMATDLLSKWRGVPFTSSAKVQWLTEGAVTTADGWSGCVLYYA